MQIIIRAEIFPEIFVLSDLISSEVFPIECKSTLNRTANDEMVEKNMLRCHDQRWKVQIKLDCFASVSNWIVVLGENSFQFFFGNCKNSDAILSMITLKVQAKKHNNCIFGSYEATCTAISHNAGTIIIPESALIVNYFKKFLYRYNCDIHQNSFEKSQHWSKKILCRTIYSSNAEYPPSLSINFHFLFDLSFIDPFDWWDIDSRPCQPIFPEMQSIWVTK